MEGSKSGSFINNPTFLHDNKLYFSRINKDKCCEYKREKKHAQGGAISQTDMIHVMLKYSEVMTKHVFITITTFSPDLLYIDIYTKILSIDNTTRDGSQVGLLSDDIQIGLSIFEWGQHRKK